MISFPYFLYTVVLEITRSERLPLRGSLYRASSGNMQTGSRVLSMRHAHTSGWEAEVDSLAKKMVLLFRDKLYRYLTTGAVWRHDVFLL